MRPLYWIATNKIGRYGGYWPGIMEDWKQICPGYLVSNLGRVMSESYNQTGNPKILKPQVNNCGYHQVNIAGKLFCVHKLVAQAFLPNPSNFTEVDHINRDKNDNRASSLAWVSLSQNRINVKDRPSKSGHRNIKARPFGWEVNIQRNGTRFSKLCSSLEEAIRVRDDTLKKNV